MLNKLKNKHRINCILGCIVCLAIAAAIAAFNMDNIKAALTEPVPLETLKAEDIKGNLRVTADIYYVLDYYSYMEKNGSTTSMEFMIPVGEQEYMGFECSGTKMRQAKENMELYWSYMDGEDVSLDTMQPIRVTGTIQPLEGESLKYFREFVDSLGWTEEEKAIFMPYVIKSGYVGNMDVVGLVFMGIMAAGFLIGGICILLSGLRGSNMKDIEKYCSSKGNREYEMQRIEQFYQMGEPVQGIRANNEYFMAIKGASIYFAPAQALLWAYSHVVQHRTNFIPTGKSYSVIVKKQDGTQFEIPMSDQLACDQALSYINTTYPYLYIGYDDQWNKMFQKNRDEMARLVWGRKSTMTQENMDFQEGMDQQGMNMY